MKIKCYSDENMRPPPPPKLCYYCYFLSTVSGMISGVFKISANALVLNDDCQTPLEVARAKGHNNVVRAIEVCF